MKNLVRITAVALLAGAVTWAAGTAWAACADLGDTTDLTCKADLACQSTIQKGALAYVASMQKAALGMIAGGQAGTNNKPLISMCASGTNVLKACQGNNGGCKVGKTPCNANADCAIPLDSCLAATGCNGKGCAKTKVPCVTDADCDGSILLNTCDPLAVALDTNECQPIMAKSPPFANVIATGQTTLLKGMLKKCATVDPADLGMNHMSDCLLGRCTSPAGVPCNVENVCISSTGFHCPSCCNYANWIPNLAQCIEASTEGDFSTGLLVDTMLRPFAKMTGTGSVAAQAKKTAAGSPIDLLPRAVLQLQGSESLVIGTVKGSDTPSQGGSLQALSLAHCSDGSQAVACLNNKDCGPPTTSHCVRNSKVCVSTSLLPSPVACTSDAQCVSPHPCPTCAAGDTCGTILTGPVKVDKCCAEDTKTHCISTHTGCTCGYTGCQGNMLTVSELSSGGTTTCLFTHTSDAGNQTTTNGAINLVTGAAVTHSPIETDVWLVTSPATACGRCDATGVCDSNSSPDTVGMKCTGAAGQLDQGCIPNGTNLATIPNPFILTTGSATLSAVFPGNKFCGFCSNDNALGCQSNAECGAGTCVASCASCNAGFHGDATMTTIDVTGEAHEYAPTMVGVFCTGRTNSALVDGNAGLPGPVRVYQPYIFAYNFSADK